MIFIFCNDYSALSNGRTDVIGVHSLSERCLLHLICYYAFSCICQLCHIHSSLNTVCSKQYGVGSLKTAHCLLLTIFSISHAAFPGSFAPIIAEITAIPSAPAAATSLIVSSFIPPMAKTGIFTASFTDFIISTPNGLPYPAFDAV